MFKLWQYLRKHSDYWKRSDYQQEEEKDEATLNVTMDTGLPTFSYRSPPPLLTAQPSTDQRTHIVVQSSAISSQMSRLPSSSSSITQPSMSSPLVAIQSSVVTEHTQQTSDWIKPADHSVAVLSADCWNMLKPVEWEALGGIVVEREVRIPGGKIAVDVLFGKRRHVLRLIQRRATGVNMRLHDTTLHLQGPTERIYRLLDFLDHLNAQVGPSTLDYVLIRCKGPEIATKLERLNAVYRSYSNVPPFDQCSIVPMEDLHFTLARVAGQSSPTLIKEVTESIYRIADTIERQEYMNTFKLDHIVYMSHHSANGMGVSSSDPENPINRLKSLCKSHLDLYDDDIVFTKQLHMTILKKRGSFKPTPGRDTEWDDVLPIEVRHDFLGPLTVDCFHISRRMHSILTNRPRHIPYRTLQLA